MAPPPGVIYKIPTLPGIKRDGTRFEGENHVDGKWVRWRRGLPRKIGGYRRLTNKFTGPVTGAFQFPHDGSIDFYAFSGTAVEFVTVAQNGGGTTGIQTRTPAGFTSGNYVWSSDIMYNAGGSDGAVICNATDASEIDSQTQHPIYYGILPGTAALTAASHSVSGGVFCLNPYGVALDNDGYVIWSDKNDPSFTPGGDHGSARITGLKLICGKKSRGGSGASPSGLIWSLDSVLRMSFVGGTALWSFDTLSSSSTILSSRCVGEFDGMFIWPGVDRWYVYNGTVQELGNIMNQDYFFSRINMTYRQKVWACENPRWGEIWWFYPSGDSTVCNDAIIFNVREKTWYDAGEALGARRGAGVRPTAWPYPLWAGSEANSDGKYDLWQHEYGWDEVAGATTSAIESYYETGDMSLVAGSQFGQGAPAPDKWVRLDRFEPDYEGSGQMELLLTGNSWAQGPVVSEDHYDFTPSTTHIDIRQQRRQMRIRITSNDQGGWYQTGQPLIHVSVGDGNQ